MIYYLRCANCDATLEVWNKLANNFDKSSNIVIAKADCRNEKQLCSIGKLWIQKRAIG